MEKYSFRGIMLMIIFIWAGMLLGISFLEAPLKFQAPNVTLALGLGIGRLVFGALNKVELVFCFSLFVLAFITSASNKFKFTLSFIVIVLAIQTFWLLPILDERAEIIINGNIPAQASPHIYYVLSEALKLITLIIIGFRLFSETIKSE